MAETLKGKSENLGKYAYVASSAEMIGSVVLEEGASVWYGAVLRGDVGTIHLGKNSNIQDNCTAHEAVKIGENTTVGHAVILHGCTIGSGCLIGMGATLMDGCVIGNGSFIAAGSLVVGGTIVPPGSMVMGAPGKVTRPLREKEYTEIAENAKHYVKIAKEQLVPVLLQD